MGHLDLGRMPRERVTERRNERTDLDAVVDGVDDVAVVAPEHAALIRDPDLSRALANPIHHPRSRFAPHHIMPIDPDGADVVGAGIHRFDELDDLLGWILQIRIQGDHVLTARVLEASQNRHVLSGVARQHDDAGHLRPLLELLPQNPHRTIVTAVVDEDELIGPLQPVERRIEPREQLREPALLVVHRNDDGNAGAHRRAPPRISFVAATTRSTSASSIAGNSGRVTVSRPIRSALGNWPSR